MLDLTEEPDLGYIFYPYEIPHYPGHPRLDIIIPAVPTYRHFDPQKAQFQVVSFPNKLEKMTIHHPWSSGEKFRVCAGRIFVSDRIHKQVEAFSFGGELQILSTEEHTVCALTSSAPIFALIEAHNLSMWLTAEAEILLAKQKAHWDPQHPHDFETHLMSLDPFLLYASCLQALQKKEWPAQSENNLNGPHFVEEEIKRLQGEQRWPLFESSMNQLFT